MGDNLILSRNENSQKLSLRYYFDWQSLENFNYNFDKNGIPRVDYGGKIGLRYNAITTAQYGLFRLQQVENHSSEQDLQIALLCADWLVANLRKHRGVNAWVYDFDLDFYGLKAPWVSGMAQGEGISLLLRAHQLNGNFEYLDAAKLAFSAFRTDVTESGVRDYLQDGTVIYEEFPTNPPSHVLNGHIFALLGIYDYGKYFGDAEAKQLFQDAYIGLAKNLHHWDIGFWCFYDLHPTHRLASRMYMKVHVQLLTILYKFTGRSEFQHTANRWRYYLRNPAFNALWACVKVIEKIRMFYWSRN